MGGTACPYPNVNYFETSNSAACARSNITTVNPPFALAVVGEQVNIFASLASTGPGADWHYYVYNYI